MIYPISNRKKFSFHKWYIHGMVNRSGDNFLSPIYMRDQSGYIILNTSICNNKHSVLIFKQIPDDIVESITMRSQCIRILLIYWKKKNDPKKYLQRTLTIFLIFVYFYFSFLFLFWGLRVRVSVMSNCYMLHDSVTVMVT